MQRNNYIALIVMTLPFLSSIYSCQAQSLSAIWKQSHTQTYKAPTSKELTEAEDLFRQHFKGHFEENHTRQWKKLGFQAHAITQNDNNFFVIREHAKQRHGRGFFIFSPTRKPGLALQAPHRYHDRYTGEIALQLFINTPEIVAAAWNTTSRKTTDKNFNNADLAHLSQSYFTAFALAFSGENTNTITRTITRTITSTTTQTDSVSAMNMGNLIQLHGFAKEKRRTPQASSADVIISSATNVPGKRILKISQCLKNTTPFNVRIYPWDVQELGGVTNTIASALRNTGSSAFVHIELNLATRKQLLNNATLRKRFSLCLPIGESL